MICVMVPFLRAALYTIRICSGQPHPGERGDVQELDKNGWESRDPA